MQFQALIVSLDQEVKRKKQIDLLLNRTPEQEEEEENLLPLSESLSSAFKNSHTEAAKLIKEAQKRLKKKKSTVSSICNNFHIF